MSIVQSGTIGKLLYGGVIACCLAGCGSEGSPGVLGNGSFGYLCMSGSDSYCDSNRREPVSLPEAVAVGGAFNLVYEGKAPKSSTGIPFQVTVVPASTTLVELLNSGGFRIVAPGHMAFLGRATNGIVADFAHVHAADIARLDVKASGGSVLVLDIVKASTSSVRVTPVDENGAELAGGLSYTWSSSDGDIVSIVSPRDNVAQLQGKIAGTATVTVSTHTDIAVTVKEP